MYFLKKGDLEFEHIQRENYVITEDIKKEVCRFEMADGSIRRNFAPMPKTNITINFIGCNQDTTSEYLQALVDGDYTFWSPKYKTHLTKTFAVEAPPDISVVVGLDTETIYHAPFSVTLEQTNEVES